MIDAPSAAYAIAGRLADAAIWHEGRCNWIGADLGEDGRSVELRALGPDLYDGSAGIALFLAEASAADGDRRLREVAIGGARHALANVDLIPPQLALGFHAGRLGVAAGVSRAGLLLEDEGLVEEGIGLAALTANTRAASGLDLLGGRAGGIIALLVMGDLVNEPGLTALAAPLGDELIEEPNARDALPWWAIDRPMEGRLTGLAHGAAGIGWALLELSAVTGVAVYASAARRAFEYERRLFDPDQLNWPDLRVSDGRSFGCTWCHGAPGIALARARAHQLLGDPELRDEAEIAAATTERMTRAMLRSGRFNYSACHGLAGNAEILIEVDSILRRSSSGSDLACEVAEVGVRDYAGRTWPCGTHVGEAPGFMVGLAGIGHFLLRVAGREMPSLLLPRRSLSTTSAVPPA